MPDFIRQQVYVLLGYPWRKPGQSRDLLQSDNTMSPEQFNTMMIGYVAIHGLLAVIGFHGDIRG